jgi:hypothetical protein
MRNEEYYRQLQEIADAARKEKHNYPTPLTALGLIESLALLIIKNDNERMNPRMPERKP